MKVFIRFLLVVIIVVFVFDRPKAERIPKNKLYPILNEYVRELYKEFKNIPEERRFRLNEIIRYIEEQKDISKLPQLMFISTNETTISHLTQIWAKTAAFYFKYENVETYSAGIKPMNITQNTILVLERAGFIVYKSNLDGVDFYKVKYSYNIPPILVFPKKVNHQRNPQEDYLAVFVEANAELNLPKLSGTLHRLLLSYDDPQGFDGTAEEAKIYDERCHQVAVEMFYVFSQLRKRDKI